MLAFPSSNGTCIGTNDPVTEIIDATLDVVWFHSWDWKLMVFKWTAILREPGFVCPVKPSLLQYYWWVHNISFISLQVHLNRKHNFTLTENCVLSCFEPLPSSHNINSSDQGLANDFLVTSTEVTHPPVTSVASDELVIDMPHYYNMF